MSRTPWRRSKGRRGAGAAQPEKQVETGGNAPQDVVRKAITSERAKLRAYRHKALNGMGNAETIAAGIARAEAEIERLENML